MVLNGGAVLRSDDRISPQVRWAYSAEPAYTLQIEEAGGGALRAAGRGVIQTPLNFYFVNENPIMK